MNQKIKNKYDSKITFGLGEDRIPIVSVLAKSSYKFRKDSFELRPLENITPLSDQDSYNGIGDPHLNSVYKPNESIPYKKYTDIVLVGAIKTYQKKKVPLLDVGIEVLGRKKIVRVYGDRYCTYQKNEFPLYSEPKNFVEMPVEYERAYGGKDTISIFNETYTYPRNPIGKGYALLNTPHLIDELQLPNYEDPNDLLLPNKLITEKPHNWNNLPLPQGFGWVAPNTYPRSSFAGIVPAYISVDEIPKEALLGIVPKNQVALSRQLKLPSYNAQFNNGASLGMIYDYLKPKSNIKLANFFEESRLMEFQLPRIEPVIYLDIGKGQKKLTTELQTIIINIDTHTIDIIWQAWQSLPDFRAFSQLEIIDYDIA
jgi:hypothetical protein